LVSDILTVVIDKVDITKYESTCFICNRKYYGPTVKCHTENCEVKFHVECARLANFQLEIIENKDKAVRHKLNDNYFIFCHRHTKIDLQKEVEFRKDLAKKHIFDFSERLNRTFNNFEKLEGYSLLKPTVHKQIRIRKKKFINDDLCIPMVNTRKKKFQFIFNKNNKKKFFDKFRDLCIRISNPNIVLERINEESYKLTEVNGKLKNHLTYNEVISPDFPWHLVTDIWNANFEIFKKLIRNERDYIKKMINFSDDIIKTSKVGEKIYCFCRKPYNQKRDTMIECVNGRKCSLGGWVHKDCCDDLKKLPLVKIEKETYSYKCLRCRGIK
jgi:hypothetical protein